MVSMTDFMQQKMIQESAMNETMKTDEELSAAVLESYLLMTEAFSGLECACEYANIASFCESAEVPTPKEVSVYLESFWDNVKDTFESVIEWFSGCIKGLMGAFASSKLQKLIAKLKQSGASDMTFKSDTDVWTMCYGTEVVIALLEQFRVTVIDEAPASKDAIAKFVDILEKAVNSDNWAKDVIKQNNAIFNHAISPALTEYLADKSKHVEIHTSTIIELLEKINKFDIPKRGKKLLEGLKFDAKAYKATDADGKEIEGEVDKEMVRDIKKCARYLAKLYDRITRGLIKITEKAYKSVKVSDEEQFKTDTEAAKKVTKDRVKYNSDDSSESRPTVSSSDEYFN